MQPHTNAPYTGRIIVRLTRTVADRLAAEITGDYAPARNRLLQLAEAYPDLLAGLVPVLLEYSRVPTRETIAPFSVPYVRRLEARAAHSPYPPLHSLISYFVVDPRGSLNEVAARALVAQLEQAPEVDLVYRESEVTVAAVTYNDETIYPLNYHGHFYGNFEGINAVAPTVWGVGHDGQGIGFGDIEGGWILTHVDLPTTSATPVFNVNSPGLLEHHGTAVLSIVMGLDNGSGVVGIAPGTSLRKLASHIRPSVQPWEMDKWAITAAILESLSPGSLVAGDVLLIELQTVGDGPRKMFPIEVVPEWFDAIRLAVGNGVVVIEPAGNGDGSALGRNLNDWNGDWDGKPTGRTLKVGDPDSDSGAIMVSGCEPAVNPPQQHERVAWLNYGERVNCYAWGREVYSAGYGDLREGPGTKDYWYTATFSETSAASAIIAGAALLVQEMHEKAWGWRLSPPQLRHALGDSNSGTAIVPPGGGNPIGVMPDLAKVAAKLGTYPDVYLRDAVGDTGVVPSTSVFQSPDIIMRHAASLNPQGDFGEGSPLANVVPPNDPVAENQDNYLYVRIRNRSGVDALAVTAHVYWSEASTLVAPVHWNKIGQIAAGTVTGGGALHVAGPLKWHPLAGQLPASGHGCFVAVLDQALDPMPPSLPSAVGGKALGWTEFLGYVGANNNVAWRNFTVVAADDAEWWPFSIRGAWDQAREFTLELVAEVPAWLPLGLEVPPELAELLQAAAGHGFPAPTEGRSGARYVLTGRGCLAIPGIRLPQDVEYPCRLYVQAPDVPIKDEATIAIRQVFERIPVGQITWRIVARGRGHRP